jgi:hypothetical protein
MPPAASGIKGKMKILPAHHYSQVSTTESIFDIESDCLITLEKFTVNCNLVIYFFNLTFN